MDIEKLSPARREVLEKIAQYEREGRFDEDVENDPPAPVLLPDGVDYGNKKLKNRVAARIANKVGDLYFSKLRKKGAFAIDGVEGRENLSALSHGAIVTCNHFSAVDSYLVSKSIVKELPKHRLWKVIREGNYTNFPGLYGFLFKHAYTLPLSSNPRTMMNFLSAVNELLKKGESILIYPEQGMWWNYRKPRPLKPGGFKMACRADVPVLPVFITMKDEERLDGEGYPIQRYTLHVLPPIYPDKTLGEKARVERMKEENFALWKAKYEEVYGRPLEYASDGASERGEEGQV